MQITDLLAFGVKNKASDLHLSAGLPPMIRVHGDIRRINLPEMSSEEVGQMITSVMNDQQRKLYQQNMETDFAFELPNVARFRVNAFIQQGRVGMVLRTIPLTLPTIDGLGDLLHAHRNHGVSNSFTITLRPVSTDLIEIIGHMQGTAYVVFPHAGGQHHGDGQGHVPESDAVIHCR